MEGYLNAISVPAIAAIVFWIMKIVTYALNNNEKFKRFVPLISALLGVVCGIVCFYALPKIIPADNFIVAAVIGAASGLTATGTDQMIKQLSKKDEKTDEKKDDNGENEKTK